ncbi:MAG: hypothetical protein WC464_08150 [Bdellovibrionales bacterium]
MTSLALSPALVVCGALPFILMAYSVPRTPRLSQPLVTYTPPFHSPVGIRTSVFGDRA